ncbi:MAG: hypothetical protein KAJ66_04265 [Candidatus Omnitrophica bacterium]|nr:hypothetical protein [Candidatus Omnitrophota bacterium]
MIKKLTLLQVVLLILILFSVSYAEEIELKIFLDYLDCFRFMAENNHLGTEEANICKLAAESSVERCFQENSEEIILVFKLNYFKGRYSTIRGAQDNGPYYIFLEADDCFEYIGRMEGSSYQKKDSDGRMIFSTTWHVSSNESIESVYEYDGETFKHVSKALYQYSPDGLKSKIRVYDTN